MGFSPKRFLFPSHSTAPRNWQPVARTLPIRSDRERRLPERVKKCCCLTSMPNKSAPRQPSQTLKMILAEDHPPVADHLLRNPGDLVHGGRSNDMNVQTA